MKGPSIDEPAELFGLTSDEDPTTIAKNLFDDIDVSSV